jgi:hypothetical protein
MRRLQDSRPVQALLCALGLFLTAGCAVGVYRRWHDGSFRLAASIAGVALFGFCAYSAGHYVVTGRHLSERFSTR